MLVVLVCGCSHSSSAPEPTTPPTTSPTTSAPPPSTTTVTTAPPPPAKPRVRVPRPDIVWKPIPFGAARRAETAEYARRHYGIDTWRLRHPHVIVEHYTAGTTFASAYNTFAQDVPDSELHELPGTCAHFVIDTDGTIYQLVRTDTICRHTVGLNWTAIGIEHVGTSDGEILGNPAQIRSSLHLTAWLMWRNGIQLRNVIGHNESLTSPYHHELYAAWRCQTHGDWVHADMQIYRHRLARLLRSYGVPLGPPARPRSTGC
jgi:N-acetylmuramoyl-L-alanine amidase